MTYRTTALYYGLLIAIVVIQALSTVITSGTALASQQSVADLQKNKADLLSERQDLERTLAYQHSLLQLKSSSVYNQFQPIEQVAAVTAPTTVALR